MRRFYIGSWTQDGVMRLDDDPNGPFCYAADAEKVIDRLREAMMRESERHNERIARQCRFSGLAECPCSFCEIAREGR